MSTFRKVLSAHLSLINLTLQQLLPRSLVPLRFLLLHPKAASPPRSLVLSPTPSPPASSQTPSASTSPYATASHLPRHSQFHRRAYCLDQPVLSYQQPQSRLS